MTARHLHAARVTPTRVVILGASGFVARALATHLADAQIACRAIGSGEIDLLQPRAIPQLETELRETDTLVITSALTPDKGKDVRTFMKNIAMMEHVCAVLERVRPAHVINISSDAVYPDCDSVVTESTAATGQGLYGLMHAVRERLLAHIAFGRVPLCIVRPCNIYGADDSHNSYGPNRFLRTALCEQRITLFGNGEELRDHVYVRDVNRFLELCMRHRTEGIVNCASGEAATFAVVAAHVMKLSKLPITIDSIPRANGAVVTHRRFDITVSRQLFPDFAFTPLETGLAECWKEMTSNPTLAAGWRERGGRREDS